MQQLRQLIHDSHHYVAKHEIACKKIDNDPISRISWSVTWVVPVIGYSCLKDKYPLTSWAPILTALGLYYGMYMICSKYDVHLKEKRAAIDTKITLWKKVINNATDLNQNKPDPLKFEVVQADFELMKLNETD